MKKEIAIEKFGKDVFYKLVNQNNNVIIAVSNNKSYIDVEKAYWDKTLKSVYEKQTKIEKIDFDTAYNLVSDNPLIIRRFYENN